MKDENIFDVAKRLHSSADWTFFDQIYILIRHKINVPKDIERWVKNSGGWGAVHD